MLKWAGENDAKEYLSSNEGASWLSLRRFVLIRGRLIVQIHHKYVDKTKSNHCADAKLSLEAIERYLQAILVDSLAFWSADGSKEEKNCLLAYVAR